MWQFVTCFISWMCAFLTHLCVFNRLACNVHFLFCSFVHLQMQSDYIMMFILKSKHLILLIQVKSFMKNPGDCIVSYLQVFMQLSLKLLSGLKRYRFLVMYRHFEMLSNVSAKRGWTVCGEAEAYQRIKLGSNLASPKVTSSAAKFTSNVCYQNTLWWFTWRHGDTQLILYVY